MFQIEKKDFGECFARGPRVSVASACVDFVSETSSLMSDLDETDREVRRLTALAFRSLACPHSSYMDVYSPGESTDVSLSLSEESSGTSKWSSVAGSSAPSLAGTQEQDPDPEHGARCAPSPGAEEGREEADAQALGAAQFECVEVALGSQEDSRGRNESRTVPKREIQFKKRERSELTVFRCSDGLDLGDGMQKQELGREDTTATPEAASSNRQLQRAESTEECAKKAKFASCHISNVISKKMQFEQELKMERGAIQDPHSSVPSTPSSANFKEFEYPAQAVYQELRRQSSKSESEVSAEDLAGGLRRRSCDLSAEGDGRRSIVRQDSCGSAKGELGALALDGQPNREAAGRGENPARSWKESVPDNQKGLKSGRAMGPGADKCHLLLSDAGILPADKPPAQTIPGDRYGDGVPQPTREKVSYLAQIKQPGYEEKASYKQSSNTLDTRQASRSTLIAPAPETAPSSRTLQVDPFGTVEQLAPNIGSRSKIITLDPKYQTLPASFKFETGECRTKDPQFDRSESLKQRTKGPIHHVRDVRKLVKNTYGALRFNVTEAKPSGPAQLRRPAGSQLSAESDPTNAPMDSNPTLPIYIQCKSVSWKGNRENYSDSSVDKKYWTYAGSTDTSRLYSSDIKLLIPSDTRKSQIDSLKKTGSGIQTSTTGGKGEGDVSIQSTDLKNSKKKNSKDDTPQIPPASNQEAARVSPKRDDTREDAKEKKAEHLAKRQLSREDCNLLSEKNKLKIGPSAGVGNQSPASLTSNSHPKGNKVEPVGGSQTTAGKPKKDSAECLPKKEESKVTTNKPGSQREDPLKLPSPQTLTGKGASLREDLSLTHGKSDSKREVQDRAEYQTKVQKVSPLRNNDTKIMAEKNEPQRVEHRSKHLSTSTLNISDATISPGKDTSERKVHSRLDHQKTLVKMSSSSSESVQELTGKGELNKESQVRKSGSKSNISENSVLKIEDMKGKAEGGREGQGKGEQRPKALGYSTVDCDDIHSPVGKDEEIRMVQLGLDKRSLVMRSSLSQTVDITKVTGRGEPKHETNAGWQKEKRFSYNSTASSEVTKPSSGKYESVKDMQVRLENQCKMLGSACEEKALSGKPKGTNESQAGVGNRSKLQGYSQSSESIKLSVCKSETKKESQSESENPAKREKVEQLQASEKTGLRMAKESQPIKDSYVLSLILEEESKNLLETSDGKIRNKQSVKHHLLNEVSAQAAAPSSVSAKDKQTVKPADQQQTVKSPAKTSAPSLASRANSRGASAFAIDIAVSASKAAHQHAASQIHSSSAEFNVKTLPPVSSLGRLSGHDQNKQGPSAAQEQPSQQHAPLESVNYLTIPVKEQKAQAPILGQTPASPHSAAFKANLSPAIPYFQHQRSVEAIDAHRPEKQTLSRQLSQEPQSPGLSLRNPYYASPSPAQPQLDPFPPGPRAASFAEALCEVPPSPADTDNPHLPCFQYPQTQRKMLVDPETGKYYFVDAPIQPSRKMLLDPETGQYVEVMMRQHPYGGVYQVPFPPYLLNPAMMGPSYLPNMPYPGLFVGPPVSSQRPLEMQSQLLSQQGSSQDKADTQHHKQYAQSSLSAESAHMETLYYIPPGVTLYPNPGQPGLQQAPMQAPSCAEVKDSKATGIWSTQHTYGVSNLLPHGRPISFTVE
uniref:cardiac-enriched FHL2-interacting protein-like n=1 Tax=Pristiophorus japonicus TaxID=55135 RepID=UPI00398E8922